VSGSLDVVLLHSALGLRPAVRRAGERMTAAGHRVHVPDVYDGAVFGDVDEGVAHMEQIGWPTLVERAEAVGAPADSVYVGWSMGAGLATHLVQSRPGARGALLLHGGGIEDGDPWPAVPVAVHHAVDDPWAEPEYRDPLLATAARAGVSAQLHLYPGTGHLFDDEDHPDFVAASTQLLWERALAWLAEL
jgi:dienelactone hydrolase